MMASTRDPRAHYIQPLDRLFTESFEDTVWLTMKGPDGVWRNAGRTHDDGYRLNGGTKYVELRMLTKFQQGFQWSMLHLQARKPWVN